MNVLIISYAFPPIKSMASYRNYLIARGLSSNGANVSVLSTRNQKFLPKQMEDLENLNVHNLPTLDYRTFNHSDKVSGTSKTGSKFKQLVRRLKNSFPLNLFFGLGGVVFILTGIWRANQIIRKNKCSLIISHFPPISNQIIAKWAKKLNPSIKWIADFHHLYVDTEKNNVVFPKLQSKWVKLLLKDSDYIITVSEGLQKGLSKLNSSNEVIELGFVESNLEVSNEVKLNNDHFCISYCGSLYDEQQFEILNRSLNSLHEKQLIDISDFKFIYAGVNSEKWDKGLSILREVSNIKTLNLGVLTREKSFNVIKNSDLNLLLSWNNEILDTIIPGKYYDYLKSRRPILLIINGHHDPGWNKRFQDLNSGFLCYENDQTQKLENYIHKLYTQWKKGIPNKSSYNEETLVKHSFQNQMKKLEKIIQDLM